MSFSLFKARAGRSSPRIGPRAAALSYAALALGWVIVSDLTLGAASDEAMHAETLKGAAFVAVSALALFGVLHGHERRAGDLMERLREAAEQSRDGFWRWDAAVDVFTVTPGGNRDLGWEAAQSIESLDGWRAVAHPDDWPQVEAALAPVRAGRAADFTVDHRVSAIDGGWIWYRVRGRAVERAADGSAVTLSGDYTNIDGLKRRELALRRANRALDAIAAVNRASLAAHDCDMLLDGACRALAAAEDCVLVWIGEAEDGAVKRVRPLCSRGPAQEFLQVAQIGWSDDVFARGPSAAALRSGRPEVVADARTAAYGHPWGEALARFEIRSSVVVPFSDGARRLILQINSREAEAFSEDEADAYQALGQDLTRALGAFAAAQRSEHKLGQALRGAVAALAATLEKRDPYTAGHQSRACEVAVAIALEMALSPDRVEAIRLGAAMHDIGKIGVPVEILTKPGRLEPQEMALMRRHPDIGYDIVKEIEFGWPIADIVRQHHERWDGSGYPQGLRGEAIALEARIVAVADVVESMATHRPYRPALALEVVLGELREGRGVRYDPQVVDAALAVLARTPIEPLSNRSIAAAEAA
ncbi:MAG: HD domain-containing phosphohydrolase [Marivibrio sp.]|uniref:HD domain-containing phosphohydrolase n=1 Tax=Marivibrio sp. TaxID=2039719 RepID=UPI0032EBF25A